MLKPADAFAFGCRVRPCPSYEPDKTSHWGADFSPHEAYAFVINCSRGSVVDLDALAAAIKIGRLAGAGLDVLDSEPIEPAHPVLGMPEVIVTSHCAWYSEESLHDLQRLAAKEVARGVLGQAMVHVVNGVR